MQKTQKKTKKLLKNIVFFYIYIIQYITINTVYDM